MPLRIGVLGAGTIGRLRARTIRDNPATRLAAVCDVDIGAATAAAAGSGATVTNQFEAFLAEPMDAVVVSTPLPHHDVACVRALDAGLHVLCEKPLANTVPGCRQVVDAAQAQNRVLAVGFNLRYYPAFRYIHEVLQSGLIGELDHLRLFGGHDGLHNFRADWQYRAPESGGGATMDIGIHMIDLGRHFLGEVTEVYGVTSERVWGVPGSEDNAMAVFRRADGRAATYHATWTEWRGFRMVVEAVGSRGLVCGAYAPMRNLLVVREASGRVRRRRAWYPGIMLGEKVRSWTWTAEQSFREELRDFVARIGGAQVGLLADGVAGWRAVEIAAAVRQSSSTGQVVSLDRRAIGS